MKDLNGKPALVVNRAQCLNCGDVLISKHRHDYVSCCCGSLSLDGGLDYLKRSYINAGDVLELSLYTDSPWEEIRCNVFRGSRGKNGDQPLEWRALSDIDDEYLKALVDYKERYTETEDIHYWAYCKEYECRNWCRTEYLQKFKDLKQGESIYVGRVDKYIQKQSDSYAILDSLNITSSISCCDQYCGSAETAERLCEILQLRYLRSIKKG